MFTLDGRESDVVDMVCVCVCSLLLLHSWWSLTKYNRLSFHLQHKQIEFFTNIVLNYDI